MSSIASLNARQPPAEEYGAGIDEDVATSRGKRYVEAPIKPFGLPPPPGFSLEEDPKADCRKAWCSANPNPLAADQ
jgi:hypothetical protein